MAQNQSHVAINTTRKCQHRCVYCFEGRRSGHRELALDEIKGLLRDASGRVPSVIFMGAEPTMNPSLVECISYAHSIGLKTYISTNAIRLSKMDFLLSCIDAGLSGIELSFHYPDEKVYRTITRANETGFHRLIGALNNIDNYNGSHSSHGLDVNTNVVVSAYNVHRIPDIITCLMAQFQNTRYMVTIKRVFCPHDDDRDRFNQEIHVPLRVLRYYFKNLMKSIGDEVVVRFRGFPLCAIPGYEHLDLRLVDWISGTCIEHNFFSQNRLDEMYAEGLLGESHPMHRICEKCDIGHLCLDRDMFFFGAGKREDLPVPVVGGVPENLEELLGKRRRSTQADL